MSSSSAPQHTVRCSSRPSPARKRPHLINSPADSRRSVRRHDDDSQSDGSVYQPEPSTKRKHPDTTTDDDASNESSHRPPKRRHPSKDQSKPPKNAGKQSEINAGSSAGVSLELEVNLVQDLEEENEKVAGKPTKKVIKYNNVRDYYDEMITVINVS